MTAPAPLGPKTLACLRETIPAFKELEAKYLPTEEVEKRYKGAVGL